MTITRQDLEDAAKAAGIELKPMEMKNVAYQGDDRFIGYMTSGVVSQFKRGWFSPLTSKADLWDLAEKCGMAIEFEYGSVMFSLDDGHVGSNKFTPHNHEECAEAVVLAAAEIWRNRK